MTQEVAKKRGRPKKVYDFSEEIIKAHAQEIDRLRYKLQASELRTSELYQQVEILRINHTTLCKKVEANARPKSWWPRIWKW